MSKERRQTQSQKILARLEASAGQWVPMPVLVEVSGAYAVHSRISDLRAGGAVIDHKNEHAPDGKTHSFYRLLASTNTKGATAA